MTSTERFMVLLLKIPGCEIQPNDVTTLDGERRYPEVNKLFERRRRLPRKSPFAADAADSLPIPPA
jgi:hypothetical protein